MLPSTITQILRAKDPEEIWRSAMVIVNSELAKLPQTVTQYIASYIMLRNHGSTSIYRRRDRVVVEIDPPLPNRVDAFIAFLYYAERALKDPNDSLLSGSSDEMLALKSLSPAGDVELGLPVTAERLAASTIEALKKVGIVPRKGDGGEVWRVRPAVNKWLRKNKEFWP